MMNIIDKTIFLPWPILISFFNPWAYRLTLGRCPSRLILSKHKEQ
jgi:hypothetical protein